MFTDPAGPLIKPIFNYVCFENNNIFKLESEGIINHDHFRGPGVDLNRDVRTYIHTYVYVAHYMMYTCTVQISIYSNYTTLYTIVHNASVVGCMSEERVKDRPRAV